MAIERKTRQNRETSEEKARTEELRKKYKHKPTPDDLAASGDYDGPVQLGLYWELRQTMAALRAERERLGLTLAQVAEASGIDKGAISRLETGKQVNPTIDTISRIAAALGMRLGLTLAHERGEEQSQSQNVLSEWLSRGREVTVITPDGKTLRLIDSPTSPDHFIPVVDLRDDAAKGGRAGGRGAYLQEVLEKVHEAITVSRQSVVDAFTHLESEEERLRQWAFTIHGGQPSGRLPDAVIDKAAGGFQKRTK